MSVGNHDVNAIGSRTVTADNGELLKGDSGAIAVTVGATNLLRPVRRNGSCRELDQVSCLRLGAAALPRGSRRRANRMAGWSVEGAQAGKLRGQRW